MKQHAEALLKGMDEAVPIRQWLESIELIDTEPKPTNENAPEAALDMSQSARYLLDRRNGVGRLAAPTGRSE